MSEQQRELCGNLFKEDRLKMDYSGSATIDGKEYFINAWVKESQASGKKFLSLSFKPKSRSMEGLE